jgi:hypothetical protein
MLPQNDMLFWKQLVWRRKAQYSVASVRRYLNIEVNVMGKGYLSWYKPVTQYVLTTDLWNFTEFQISL